MISAQGDIGSRALPIELFSIATVGERLGVTCGATCDNVFLTASGTNVYISSSVLNTNLRKADVNSPAIFARNSLNLHGTRGSLIPDPFLRTTNSMGSSVDIQAEAISISFPFGSVGNFANTLTSGLPEYVVVELPSSSTQSTITLEQAVGFECCHWFNKYNWLIPVDS